MYIYKITNWTKKSIENGKQCHAELDNKGRLVQKEFLRLMDSMFEGVPTFIKGVEVKPTNSPMPIIGYEKVYFRSKDQLPDCLRTLTGPTFYPTLLKYNEDKKKEAESYITRRTECYKDLNIRNIYYNDIMLTCLHLGITAYSPCGKTYWEAKAQYDFEGSIPEDGEISDEQIAYVERNARKFGLEIPQNDFYIASREAFAAQTVEVNGYTEIVGYKSHGYTQEIHRVIHTRQGFNESRFGETIARSKESMRNALHPNNIPEEWLVQTRPTTKGQYLELYKQLKYIESLDPETRDFFIADGYCRCPVCGEITRKVNDGVRVFCEYCNNELEDFVTCSNDHLLYGTDIDQTYSNLDDIQDYADDQMRFMSTDEEGDEYDTYE